MKFKIALVQMDICDDSKRNLKKMESFVGAARKKDADLVVFPEIALSGNSENTKDFDVDNRFRDKFAALAEENSVDLVPGSVVVPNGKKLHNIAYYIDRKGRELARYSKQNLWLSERGWMEQGKSHAVAKTRFGKVGLLICWDMSLPELFAPIVKEGAELIVCPSYWWYGPDLPATVDTVKALAMARSFECLSILAYCNAAGTDSTGRVLLGRSQVVNPYDSDVKILDHNKEGLLVADVDTGKVDELEKWLGIRRARMERI